MSLPKYSQLHRKLLFHWTGPRKKNALNHDVPLIIKSRSDREKYLDLLEAVLLTGLRFSTPGDKNTEWVEKDSVRATHPMLCFSEWGVAESNSHSGRYGYMGLGFTRKYVMHAGGRPVVYISNKRSDPFRKALLEMIKETRKDSHSNEKIRLHADLLASYLKAYHFKRIRDESKSASTKIGKSANAKSVSRQDDHDLRLDFGGVFSNLEDREWRILSACSAKQPQHLDFSPGELAMIVFPDHQTLSLAMHRRAIMHWIRKPEKPSVCLISREMIMSM